MDSVSDMSAVQSSGRSTQLSASRWTLHHFLPSQKFEPVPERALQTPCDSAEARDGEIGSFHKQQLGEGTNGVCTEHSGRHTLGKGDRHGPEGQAADSVGGGSVWP